MAQSPACTGSQKRSSIWSPRMNLWCWEGMRGESISLTSTQVPCWSVPRWRTMRGQSQASASTPSCNTSYLQAWMGSSRSVTCLAMSCTLMTVHCLPGCRSDFTIQQLLSSAWSGSWGLAISCTVEVACLSVHMSVWVCLSVCLQVCRGLPVCELPACCLLSS